MRTSKTKRLYFLSSFLQTCTCICFGSTAVCKKFSVKEQDIVKFAVHVDDFQRKINAVVILMATVKSKAL